MIHFVIFYVYIQVVHKINKKIKMLLILFFCSCNIFQNIMTVDLSKYFHFSLFSNGKIKMIWVPHCLDLSAFIFTKATWMVT